MDVLTKKQRRDNMRAIRNSGTKIERELITSLRRNGHRFRENDSLVFGKPDISFERLKIAVFVDSEYFHGKNWEVQKYRIKTNRSFWWSKIEKNIERDKTVNRYLRREGWIVIRFWGNQIRKKLANCVSIIEKTIKLRKMTIKYTDVRKMLNLGFEKNVENDSLAHFTHFLQNHKNGISGYYKNGAKHFLEEAHSRLGVVTEPDIQYYLPIRWDIPFPPPSNPKFTFIDLFAGIGGMRLAFQNLGGKCVFSSEWNDPARRTYEVNFGEVPFGDITRIPASNIPDHDLLLAGFPCQPFSIAGVSKKNALGKAHGFLDKTQGTLFFDIARIIERKKPKVFFLENVKNLVSHDKGQTFQIITETLSGLGYSILHQVVDAKYFVPQHRERIFIVGFRKSVFKDRQGFKFPNLNDAPVYSISDILESYVDSKYTLSDHLWKYLRDYARKHQLKGNGFGYGLVALDGVSRTLSARYYKDGSEILIPQKDRNPRRLTPRECARLQGFPDRFLIPVSDTQAYKQFGNSVAVPLVQATGRGIAKDLTSSQ